MSDFTYSLFHKTLPRSSLQMFSISVSFYEMGDSCVKYVQKKLFLITHKQPNFLFLYLFLFFCKSYRPNYAYIFNQEKRITFCF